MDATRYQTLAKRTLLDGPGFILSDQDIMTLWTALGLAGEAGEVAEIAKKGIFHQHGLDKDRIKKELGDVLWYAAGLASTLGFDLSSIMHENIEKLEERYPEGFTSDDSIARRDVK